jgi:hypothetical protein
MLHHLMLYKSYRLTGKDVGYDHEILPWVVWNST